MIYVSKLILLTSETRANHLSDIFIVELLFQGQLNKLFQ